MQILLTILSAITSIRDLLDKWITYKQEKNRVKEKESIEELKKETKKNIKNDEIDELNDKLKF